VLWWKVWFSHNHQGRRSVLKVGKGGKVRATATLVPYTHQSGLLIRTNQGSNLGGKVKLEPRRPWYLIRTNQGSNFGVKGTQQFLLKKGTFWQKCKKVTFFIENTEGKFAGRQAPRQLRRQGLGHHGGCGEFLGLTNVARGLRPRPGLLVPVPSTHCHYPTLKWTFIIHDSEYKWNHTEYKTWVSNWPYTGNGYM
jgi:hypothetical protein